MQSQSSAFRDLVWLGSRRRALRIIAVWLSLAASVGFCQETDPNASEARQPPVETVTAEEIDRALNPCSPTETENGEIKKFSPVFLTSGVQNTRV